MEAKLSPRTEGITASPTGRLPRRTHRRPLASQGQHRPPTPRPRPPPRLTLEAEAHRPGSAPPWLVPLSSEGGTWRGWRPIRAARTPLTKGSARVGESSAQAPLRGEGRRQQQQQRRARSREGTSGWCGELGRGRPEPGERRAGPLRLVLSANIASEIPSRAAFHPGVSRPAFSPTPLSSSLPGSFSARRCGALVPPAMAVCRRLARLAANLQDPRGVAAFQRLCGVEGPAGWAGSRGPVANGGSPPGGRRHPAGNGAVPGGAAPPQLWRRPRRNSLTEEDGCQEFNTHSRFLYYLFSLGTELGNELFYILFFPFCIWNLDAWLGRRLIIIWVWVMYLGQCTKDVIRWPRPASPPVVKLEVFYNSEYSMPSTHAMSGTAIPLALLLLSYGRWQVTLSSPSREAVACHISFLFSLSCSE